MEDQELDRLLREWKAPDAPSHLSVPRARGSRLRWLVTGSIRVPVPVAAAALLLVGLWVATTRTAPLTTPEPSTPRRSGEVARYPLTGPLAGYDAVILEFNFGPGVVMQPHRHQSFVTGYVVEGQMLFGINNEREQVVPPGGTFFEPNGALHSAFGSASRDAPARILGFTVAPSRRRGPA